MTTLSRKCPRAKRHPQPRSVALHYPPCQGFPGNLTITVGKVCKTYLLFDQPSDWGRAFRIEAVASQDPTEGPYDVLIDPLEDRAECSCLGFLRHRQCKHSASLKALMRSGQL